MVDRGWRIEERYRKGIFDFFDVVILIGVVDFVMEFIDVDLSGYRKGRCVFYKYFWVSSCYFFYIVVYIVFV